MRANTSGCFSSEAGELDAVGNTRSVAAPSATAEALRGAVSSRSISPNTSPSTNRAISCSAVVLLPPADGDAALLHEVQLFAVRPLREDDLARPEAAIAAVAGDEGELVRTELGKE